MEPVSPDTEPGAQYFHNPPQPWWKRWPEFRRYILFGCLNTVLTYLIYLVCLRFVTYRLAYTVSFISGILISYFLNSHFVFKKELRVTKALQFVVVYLSQYCAGLGLLFLMVEVAGISKILAPGLLILLIVPINYGLNRRIIRGGAR